MLRKLIWNFLRERPALLIETLLDEAADYRFDIDVARLPKIARRSLRIRQIDAGSCNACEWECAALNNPVYDIQRLGIDFVASPRHADILMVTGPVSRQMERALVKTVQATPEPRIVIACGDCAIDGGIYRGSFAVRDGVGNVMPVHLKIPGCPPSPAQIVTALVVLNKALSSLPDRKT